MIIKKEINLEVEYDVNTGKISFELDVDMLKNSKKPENKKLLSIAVDEWFSYIQQSIEQTTYEICISQGQKSICKRFKRSLYSTVGRMRYGSSYSFKRQMGKEISKRHQKLGSQLE